MFDHPDCLGGPHFDASLCKPDGSFARLHKGASNTVKITNSQKRMEAAQYKLLQQQLKAAEKPMEMPSFDIPKADPVAPAAQQSSKDTTDAAAEEMRKAKKRTNAGVGTLFAGETGGYKPLGGQKTLLG